MKTARIRKAGAMMAGVGMLLAAAVARAEVEFSSYIRTGAETRFVLTDAATGKRSELLAVGGSFAGVTVTDFDWQTETLTVKDEQGTRGLKMPAGGEAPRPRLEASTADPGDAQARFDQVNARRKERGKPDVTPEEIAQRMQQRAAKKPEMARRLQDTRPRKDLPDAAQENGAAPMAAPDRAALMRQLRQAQGRLEKLRSATDRPKQQAKQAQAEADVEMMERTLREMSEQGKRAP